MCTTAVSIVCFLGKVNEFILNPLIALAFALATAYFFYSIFRFLRLEAGDKMRDEAKRAIVWGLFGMLIMFSAYGIINNIVLPSFGISPSDFRDSPGVLKFLGL